MCTNNVSVKRFLGCPRLAIVTLTLLGVAACSSDEQGAQSVDGGVDATNETSTDASPEGATDSGSPQELDVSPADAAGDSGSTSAFLTSCEGDEAKDASSTAATVAAVRATLGLKEATCAKVAEAVGDAKVLDLSFAVTKGLRLSDLSPLCGLKNLEALYVDDNDVASLSSLTNVPNLRYLSIAKNQLKDVSSVTALTKLKWLDASHNQIQSLQGIETLRELESLYLRGNPVSDFGALTGLANLKVKVLTNEDVCEQERSMLWANQTISEGDYYIFRGAKLGPRYYTSADPESEIEGWYACDEVVENLKSAGVKKPL